MECLVIRATHVTPYTYTYTYIFMNLSSLRAMIIFVCEFVETTWIKGILLFCKCTYVYMKFNHA